MATPVVDRCSDRSQSYEERCRADARRAERKAGSEHGTSSDDVRGDWISDFGCADILDYGAIDANVTKSGDQAFSLIGTRAFMSAAGQLRSVTENGTTCVSGDTNGDRIADFTLSFNGTYQLNPADVPF